MQQQHWCLLMFDKFWNFQPSSQVGHQLGYGSTITGLALTQREVKLVKAQE